MARHCSECMFCTPLYSEEIGKWQAQCSRGFSLLNPKLKTAPENRFADDPTKLVPMIDPFGEIYLRSSNVCENYRVPEEGKNLQFDRDLAQAGSTQRDLTHHGLAQGHHAQAHTTDKPFLKRKP